MIRAFETKMDDIYCLLFGEERSTQPLMVLLGSLHYITLGDFEIRMGDACGLLVGNSFPPFLLTCIHCITLGKLEARTDDVCSLVVVDSLFV